VDRGSARLDGTTVERPTTGARSSRPRRVHLQGEISGLSRSVSNLGSSLGAAIAGTILVAQLTSTPQRSYALALIVLAVIGVAGLVAAAKLPATSASPTAPHSPDVDAPGLGMT
jgi:hypothetical protein